MRRIRAIGWLGARDCFGEHKPEQIISKLREAERMRLKELERENGRLKRSSPIRRLRTAREGDRPGNCRPSPQAPGGRDRARRLGVSCWACRVVGQHRSTQRYEPIRASDDAALLPS